jgi:hypothetical protein
VCYIKFYIVVSFAIACDVCDQLVEAVGFPSPGSQRAKKLVTYLLPLQRQALYSSEFQIKI